MKTRLLHQSLLAVWLAFSAMSASHVQAQAVHSEGEYLYGPETSEALACKLAELTAKQNALARHVGEDLSIDQSYACSESGADFAEMKSLCTLDKFLWSQIRGEITSYRVLDQKVSKILGARKCTVTIEAQLQRLPVSGARFDFSVHLNAQTLRIGEPVRMRIQPAGQGYLTVYNWLTSEGDSGQLSKVFPNSHQPESLLNAQLMIPNEDYDIVVGEAERSKHAGKRPPAVFEHLVFVMTGHDMPWPAQLSYDDFSKKVSEIDPATVRIKKKTLSIVVN